MSLCEWNPKANRAAWEDEEHATATVCLGAKGEWHLCDDCSRLPRFKRFRKRLTLIQGGKDGDK